MPLNATKYDGSIDFIGSVEEIATEIGRRIDGPQHIRPASA
jgi:hypothetical protein